MIYEAFENSFLKVYWLLAYKDAFVRSLLLLQVLNVMLQHCLAEWQLPCTAAETEGSMVASLCFDPVPQLLDKGHGLPPEDP